MSGYRTQDERAPAVKVVFPLVGHGDIRQAQYYKTVLNEQRAHVDGEIADHYVALAKSQESGDLREMRRVTQTIQKKQREQFELDCLREALEHRFFPTLATRATPVRCFDIEIVRHGSWWRVHIPEINNVAKARNRGEAEMMARQHVALSVGTPIAEVAVRVLVLGAHSDSRDGRDSATE